MKLFEAIRSRPPPLRRTGVAMLVALLVACCAACSTLDAPLQRAEGSAGDRAATLACVAWFEQLDTAIDAAGVRDAAARRVEGFPYLRVDRFAASFRDTVRSNPALFETWFGRLKELDAEAREHEIRNLPANRIPIAVGAAAAERDTALQRTQSCAALLAGSDGDNSNLRDLVIRRAGVPDHYSDAKRVLGLYALSRLPFWRGVEAWQRETESLFEKTRNEATAGGAIVRHAVSGEAVGENQVLNIFSNQQNDALGIPRLTAEQVDTLFRAYAPAFEIETTGPYDRIGALAWRNAVAPDVDTAHPVVYRRLAYTRFNGRILVQLVYTIWFPERPADGAFDLLAGRLDGVMFRVTLDSDGRPLAYDSIHACGCYHLFIPTAKLKPMPAPEAAMEWAFVPQTLPAPPAAQRVTVRIASRTHYVTGVRPDSGGAAGTPQNEYRFADDNTLRSLPGTDGGTRSAFGPDGIVPGTERGERFTFWPMGIANAGAMRQWGTHATAFVGRRHFDDADLLERRFASDSAADAMTTSPAP